MAAITLEKSPLQMRVTSGESGHAFVEPKVPTFKISLTNITPATQAYTLTLQAVHLRGSTVQAQRSGRVEPGRTSDISVPLDKDGVVHYPLTLRKLVVELNEKVLHL